MNLGNRPDKYAGAQWEWVSLRKMSLHFKADKNVNLK
jgi:hypothetical protein